MLDLNMQWRRSIVLSTRYGIAALLFMTGAASGCGSSTPNSASGPVPTTPPVQPTGGPSSPTNVGPSSSVIPSSAAASSLQPSAGGLVLRQTSKPVAIARNQAIDLDSPADDWGVTSNGTIADDLFLNYDQQKNIGFLEDKTASHLVLVNQESSLEQCADAIEAHKGTGLEVQLTPEQTRAGTMLCIRTSEERLAYVKINHVGQSWSMITVDIIVWR